MILVILGIFLGLLILTFVLLILVIRGIVKPIEEVLQISNEIISDIGSGKKNIENKNIKKNAHAVIEEVVNLKDKIDDLRGEIEKNKQLQSSKTQMENKFYGNDSKNIPWVLS